MNTSEKTFKKRVVKLLENRGFHCTLHEDKHLVGIPDVSYGVEGINGWIEFKWGKYTYQPGQEKWLSERACTGGHVFVMIGHDNGAELYDIGRLLRYEFTGEVDQYVTEVAYRLSQPLPLGSASLSQYKLPPGYLSQPHRHLRPV